MSATNDGELGGMSLRDCFAAKALQGLLAQPGASEIYETFHDYAGDAYRYADAMLSAREQGGKA